MTRTLRQRTFSHRAVPCALVVGGLVVLLGGCLYVPQAGQRPTFVRDVGGKNSRKPIRVGVSTRDEVKAHFDRPGTRPEYFPSNEPLRYSWTEPAGTWLGTCYPGWPTDPPERERTRVAAFYFDERGVLRLHRIE